MVRFASFLALLFLLNGSLCIPPPTPEEAEAMLSGHFVLKEADMIVGQPSLLHRVFKRVPLKTYYVDHSGRINTQSGGYQIRVDATQGVSSQAHYTAATTVAKMTQHMSSTIFNSVASKTKVGIFTRSESLTVFPQYAYLANPAGCGISCSGRCATSCTFDGRKYSSLAGTGGQRAVCVDDNVLCNSNDPYRSQSNILAHEFAHTIHGHALSSTLTSRITSAYNNARRNGIWTNQYGMANAQEYWATATSAFFNSEHLTTTSAGMNMCGGSLCRSEYDVRMNIYRKDISLYGLLLEVYLNNDASIYLNMGTCTHY